MDAVNPDDERLIEGQGTPEAAWRNSAWMHTLATTTAEDLLRHCGRLVVVAPHPDDEILGCGGLMRMAVEAGHEVMVVSVSEGEQCYPGHAYWTPDRLRAARPRELEAAVHQLGISASRGGVSHEPACSIVSLGIADGKITESVDAVVAALQFIVRPDDMVLVTWGKDGHPDHEACHAAVRTVASRQQCAVREYPVWGWHWATPDTPDWLAGRAVRLDLAPAVQDAKRRAIAAFATQTGTCTPAVDDPVLPVHIIRRFERPFEVYFQ